MKSIPSKYLIYAKLEVDGIVEKPDVIGAIFGQMEGLLGTEMNLHELQKGGRIGRIKIELKQKAEKTTGLITIPSNLDRPSTALIAAAIESVDRIGPYSCKIILDRIVDIREERRKAIKERAKEILRQWTFETRPQIEELLREIAEAAKAPDIIPYGPEKLPAGPMIDRSSSIIIVEGRADVGHLLRYGYENVIALEGAKIPRTIIELCKEREATAFLDGDRSADLILKELLRVANIDFIARAPLGKEVEELTAKEIARALRERVPVETILGLKPAGVRAVEIQFPKEIVEATRELKGTLEAILFDEKMDRMARIPVSELLRTIKQTKSVHAIVLDGLVTKAIVDQASGKGVKLLVGNRISQFVKVPPSMTLLTFATVLKEG